MIDATDKLMESWVSLLTGISVPVYDESVPIAEKGNYVQLRIEGETEQPIGSRFWTKPVFITDVVTRFSSIVNPKIARGINTEIIERVVANESNNLPIEAGLQFGNLYKQRSDIINEYDGSRYYYRIVTRYKLDIIQQKN